MKPVLRLLRLSYRVFLNDRVAVGLTFFVPLVLMSLFGAIFGRSDVGIEAARLAFLNQSPSPVAKAIERTLDTMKAFRLIRSAKGGDGLMKAFDTTSVKEYVRSGRVTAALVFPSDAYTDTSIGLKIKFYYDPKNEIEIQTVQGLLQKTIMEKIPLLFQTSTQRMAERHLGSGPGREFNRGIAKLLGKYFNVDTSLILNSGRGLTGPSSMGSPPDAGGFDFFKNMVQIEREQLVGKELANPWATRSVGGWAMTFLLFTLTAAASSLFDEKKSGITLRFLTSPVRRVHILWSTYLFNMLLGVIQLLFLFSAGWLMFDIDITRNFLNLLLVILAASTACTAFGMLLAAFCRTRQQAQGLGTMLILVMSAIGGAWFPLSFMPETVQFFSKLTIVYWSMDGFLEVLWRGSGIVAILPHLAILFGTAALLNVVSVLQFRKGRMF